MFVLLFCRNYRHALLFVREVDNMSVVNHVLTCLIIFHMIDSDIYPHTNEQIGERQSCVTQMDGFDYIDISWASTETNRCHLAARHRDIYRIVVVKHMIVNVCIVWSTAI